MKKLLLLILSVSLPFVAVAQEDDTVDIPYQMPPDDVVRIVDAPPAPGVSISPDREWIMIMDRASLPTIEELAQPELRLAGIRINPATNGPSRATGFVGLNIRHMQNGEKNAVDGLPASGQIRNVSWSPDSQRFVFTITTNEGVELWAGSTADATAARVGDFYINDTYYGSSISWTPSGKEIIVRKVPSDRGDVPEAALAPVGPVIQQNLGRSAPARTYQDLLQNSHDEDLFEYYFTSLLAVVDIESGSVNRIGDPRIYGGVSASPDGQYVLVSYIQRPYSYLVPAFRFPQVTEIWDMEGNLIHTVADIPLQDEIPIGFGSTSVGPRSITWRNDAPATVVWTEAQDEGNPRAEVEYRDIVYMQNAPFSADPVELARLENRYAGIMWGHDDLALVSERWFSTRNEKVWHVRPGTPEAEQTLIRDRNYEDIYNDPGSPQMRTNESGYSVLLTDESGYVLYLTGQGASPDGNQPFLDSFDIRTGETEQLWQSSSPYYEFVVSLLDEDAVTLITRRESVTMPPNYYLVNRSTGQHTAITEFEHPNPELIDVFREIIFYEREDGIPLSGTLLLPPGYDKDEHGRLPLMVWAYPREFRSADAAGQRSDSPYRFNNISYWGPQWLVTQGYAVLDAATMPVVGEGDKLPNDSFVEQLIMNSQAAVDAIADMGIADPDRAAIGGHSYGAFMTANVLAHSDIFRAGIARSGAFNRSLTPFGFQREERTVWDDTDLYIRMSPFFHADKINQPILLIHGAEDNNSGTFPMQSERLYQAIKGLGGIARLVMLPHESHGYRARESVMHMLWETLEWLDTYVKNAEAVTAESSN